MKRAAVQLLGIFDLVVEEVITLVVVDRIGEGIEGVDVADQRLEWLVIVVIAGAILGLHE